MKALIAMSGGVDSSVAAKLTKEAGYECIGCTMKLFDSDTAGNADDARKVAERLGMPFHVFDLRDLFRSCVIDGFVDAYSHGITPNPCIECNRNLKFGELMQRAAELGCDKVVTGHYVRVEKDETAGKYLLRKGLDESKDQSYVLYNLTQDQLAHVLFPLGGLTKTQVRELAGADGFENADKSESQDICFVPDGDYAAVVEKYAGRSFPEGDYVDLDGNVIGTHKGIIHYTIGQTRGLGQAFGEKRYVCRIDAEKNQVVLGSNDDVFSSTAKAVNFNWISGETPEGEIRCRVRVRYKQKEQPATVRPTDGNTVEIIFDEPQRAITPGQSAVLYDEDIVLGGGIIV
ncbi:MAG: tRNA 2-thiouridine(34) synthase MnmA [Bacillota bacterium]